MEWVPSHDWLSPRHDATQLQPWGWWQCPAQCHSMDFPTLAPNENRTEIKSDGLLSNFYSNLSLLLLIIKYFRLAFCLSLGGFFPLHFSCIFTFIFIIFTKSLVWNRLKMLQRKRGEGGESFSTQSLRSPALGNDGATWRTLHPWMTAWSRHSRPPENAPFRLSREWKINFFL